MESRSQNVPYKAHDVFASGDDNVIYFLVSELESSAMMVIAAAMNTVAFK